MSLASLNRAATNEPSVALRAVLDLSVHPRTPALVQPLVQDLARQVEGHDPAEPWRDVYGAAIRVVEATLRECDGQIEQLARSGMAMEDGAEIRRRHVDRPRADADKARAEARAAIQRIAAEWSDRLRRQHEDVVVKSCFDKWTARRQVEEIRTPEGVELRVEPAWWADFARFVRECCDNWTESATRSIQNALAHALQPIQVSDAFPPLRFDAPPVPAPSNEVALREAPPSREVDVPSLPSAMMRDLRASLGVATFLGMIGGAFFGLDKLFGGSSTGSAASQHGAAVRSGLVILTLPVALYLGLRVARREQARVRKRGMQAWLDAAGAHVKDEVSRAADRHRRSLERWLKRRTDDSAALLERWWEQSVAPALAQAEAVAQGEITEAAMRKARLSQEQNGLSMYRNQLAQTTLIELRKRQRELAVRRVE